MIRTPRRSSLAVRMEVLKVYYFARIKASDVQLNLSSQRGCKQTFKKELRDAIAGQISPPMKSLMSLLRNKSTTHTLLTLARLKKEQNKLLKGPKQQEDLGRIHSLTHLKNRKLQTRKSHKFQENNKCSLSLQSKLTVIKK